MSFADSHHPDAKNRSENEEKSSQKHRYHHVMCFGTFDIFHPGHEFYLSEAEKLADKMTIVIARDHRVSTGKWRDPVHDEIVRRDIIERAFPDVRVILWDESDIFAPLREYQPDLLAFGYDQRVPEALLQEKFPQIEIVRIGGYETEKWKSSILRNLIN